MTETIADIQYSLLLEQISSYVLLKLSPNLTDFLCPDLIVTMLSVTLYENQPSGSVPQESRSDGLLYELLFVFCAGRG